MRVLAATNRDLADGVRAARFRQDLYYRLKVVELHVPPLRERRDDILPLARVLLADAAQRTEAQSAGRSRPRRRDQLLRYDWPGNVRELENVVERASVLATRTASTSRICPRRCGRLPPPETGRPVLARRGRAQAHPGRAARLGRQPGQGGGHARHRRGDALPQAEGVRAELAAAARAAEAHYSASRLIELAPDPLSALVARCRIAFASPSRSTAPRMPPRSSRASCSATSCATSSA